jgi:alpha-D-xyloside xylohydrolase
LPASTTWTNFWTGGSVAGGKRLDIASPEEQIPLFVRAGGIIPLGPDLQYATEKPADPIELRVYRGGDGSFSLYEDEGDSYRYEKGAYATIPVQWNEASKILTICDRAGEFPGMLKERTFHIVWVRPGKGIGPGPEISPDAEVTYVGKKMQVKAP